jgi:hypothetical protein
MESSDLSSDATNLEVVPLDTESWSHDLSRRRLLAGAGAAGALAGVAGLIPGRGADPALAAGANDGVVSVKDFGAKGDGVTDDSAAIQKAVDETAGDGRTVFLPAGVYMLQKAVHMRDGLTMKGAGRFVTILRLMPSSNGPILETQVKNQFDEDLTLMDVTLDGDAGNTEQTGGSVALLHTYNIRRWHVARCRIMRGRGYGAGLQGNPNTGNGPQEDIYFADCEFDENHYGGVEGTGSIDIKSCKRFTMVNCTVRKDGVGFDVRAHFATYINCHARECEFGFVLRQTDNLAGSTEDEAYFTVIGGSAEDCGAGIAIAHNNNQETDKGYTHVTVIGFNARNNIHGIGTSNPTPPNTDNAIALSVLGGQFSDNEGYGLGISTSRNFTASGAVCRKNSYGINLRDTENASISGCDLSDNENWGIGMEEEVLPTNRVAAVGNTVMGNGAGAIPNMGPNSKIAANTTDEGSSVTAASTITLPESSETVVVTGTTSINSIKASFGGRRVVLVFLQALTVVNGSNLKLKGNFNATGFDTLTLVCQGGTWYELSRSVN